METLILPPLHREIKSETERGIARCDLPPVEAPLLPPMLSGPAAFLWLWALPIAVLLLLNAQGYWLIEGNMNEAQRTRALLLGLSGAANLLVGLALFVTARMLSARGASALAQLTLRSAPALVVQVAYLWFATASADAILPANVTTWIYPSSRFFFNQFSFAMLPLFFGVLQVACAPSGARLGKTIVLNLSLAIGGPILFYVLAQGVRLFDHAYRLSAVVLATGMIALGVAMFVGLVRALMFSLRSAQRSGPGVERMAIVCFALVMPLGGLLLNRAIPFPVDFQAWEVYALVVANTAILLLASWRHAQSPRLSFCLLCATFPFSLYFFIVFLPYTPLSILAVILMGAGFLVLTPTLLFALHLHLLNKARQALGTVHGQTHCFAAGLLCFLIIPAFFAGRAAADRTALNAALTHVYTPAITRGDIVYPRSITDLRRALRSHRDYKNGIYYPLLSDFYSWYVFNHLVLPDDKLAHLEQTFLGAVESKHSLDPTRSTRAGLSGGSGVRERSRMPRARPPSRDVEVADLAVRTRAAGEQNSIVTFALTLRNRGAAAAEYVKALPLPPGIFVSGFRLHINGAAVPGRIFEKKTALWVYTMIRDSERRDPGLLFYNTPEELELRVFPIAGNGTATVEIDFLVPGSPAPALPVPSRDPAVALAALGAGVPAQLTRGARGSVVAGSFAAQKLPLVEREPYLHLIVDRSAIHGYTGDLSNALPTLRVKFPAARRARVTLVNHDVVDFRPQLTPLDELAALQRAALQWAMPASGGFALDLALAHAIRRHRDQDLDQAQNETALPPRPIFVVLSDATTARALPLKLTEEWLDLVPRFEVHELSVHGALTTHHSAGAIATPLLRLGNSLRPLTATRPVRFAASAETTRLEFWSPASAEWLPVVNLVTQPNASRWSRAVALQLQQQDYARSPGEAALDLKALVAASRSTGILLAGSSYIVVENSAQWRMLEQSEQQKLSENAALNFLETPAPPVLYVALGFGAWMAIARVWRRRRAANPYPA